MEIGSAVIRIAAVGLEKLIAGFGAARAMFGGAATGAKEATEAAKQAKKAIDEAKDSLDKSAKRSKKPDFGDDPGSDAAKEAAKKAPRSSALADAVKGIKKDADYPEVLKATFWDKFKDRSMKALQALMNAAPAMGKALESALDKLSGAASRVPALMERAGQSISSALRLADPGRVAIFQGTLGALMVQIGSIFIPVLEAANQKLQMLLQWFRGLNDEQKDNILRWVAVAAAVAGLIALVPKLIGMIRLASAAMSMFGVSTGVATAGITTILGVLASLGASWLLVNARGEESGGIMGKIMSIGKSLWATLGKLVEPLMAFASQIIDEMMPVFDMLIEAGNEIFNNLKDFFVSLLAPLGELVNALKAVFLSFMPLLKLVFALSAALQSIFLPIISGIIAVFAKFITQVLSVVAVFMNALAPVFESVSQAFLEFGDVLSTVLEAAMPLLEIFLDVFNVIVEQVKTLGVVLADVIKGLLPILKDVLAKMLDMIENISRRMAYLAGLIKALRSRNFSGAIDEARKAEAEFDKRLADRRTRRKGPIDLTKGAKLHSNIGGSHKPKLVPKVELIGFAELWRRAQQSSVMSPDQMIKREQIEISKKQLAETQKQTQIMEGDVAPCTMGAGGFGA